MTFRFNDERVTHERELKEEPIWGDTVLWLDRDGIMCRGRVESLTRCDPVEVTIFSIGEHHIAPANRDTVFIPISRLTVIL